MAVLQSGKLFSTTHAHGSKQFRRFQIMAVAGWLAVSGGYAMHRTLSDDPRLKNGRKCVVIGKFGHDNLLKLNGLSEDANIFDMFDAGSPYFNSNGECSKASLQAIVDLRLHPISTVLGSLLPTIVLAPFVYFGSGWLLRRHDARLKARFKVCEHCAERIRSAAKVCRYCGRDVSPQTDVTSIGRSG